MSLRKLILGFIILFAFALGFSQAAHAQNKMFTFTFSSPSLDVTGTLFASTKGGGKYTAYSGSIDIPSNGGGFAPGTYTLLPVHSVDLNDNIVYPTANPILDMAGVSFSNQAGFYDFNLAGYSPGVYGLYESETFDPYNGRFAEGTLTFTSVALPEFSPLVGFGSFVVLGGLLVLRRRKPVHSPH